MYYTNKDIRIAMIENDISSGELAKEMGYSEHYMSVLIKTEPLEWTRKVAIKRAINKIKENRI